MAKPPYRLCDIFRCVKLICRRIVEMPAITIRNNRYLKRNWTIPSSIVNRGQQAGIRTVNDSSARANWGKLYEGAESSLSDAVDL